MREIKFRAKDLKRNEWVYGSLVIGKTKTWIVDAPPQVGIPTQMVEVDPKTVGQFVEFCDINKSEIYEGDVVKYKTLHGFDCENDDWRESSKIYEGNEPRMVEYIKGQFWPREYYNYCEDGFYATRWFDIEIIDNEYENPELLK